MLKVMKYPKGINQFGKSELEITQLGSFGHLDSQTRTKRCQFSEAELHGSRSVSSIDDRERLTLRNQEKDYRLTKINGNLE